MPSLLIGKSCFSWAFLAIFLCSLQFGFAETPQSVGTAGSLIITVTDQTGAVIPGATVTIGSLTSGYKSSSVADSNGVARFLNLPLNAYHLSIEATGFQGTHQDAEIRSSVPSTLTAVLAVGSAGDTVTVEAHDLVEVAPTAHTDIDTTLMDKLPLESVNSGLASLVSQATPGVVQDSNGMAHPQGEHGDTTYSIDGQPVSDQQSRSFSNSISQNAVQSLEVLTGVPSAEYGDKASMVVRTVTKSGLGITRPTGDISASYGSFGTSALDADLSVGNQKWGNFFSIDLANSGRFLDSPEFFPIHDHGNSESIFERIDYQINNNDTLHLNLLAGRSWFQIPNDFDQFFAGQDQRQQNRNFDVAPFYQHLFSPTTLMTVNAYVRQDRVGYFPSGDLFFDQPATIAETRRLTNAGIKTDLSYVKGIQNIKTGIDFNHTFLSEHFNLGVTNPTYNAVCLTPAGTPDGTATPTDPTQCATLGAGYSPNPAFLAGLLPYDLTRAGRLFNFQGRTDIKQLAMYVEDTITIKNLTLNLGLRGDIYRGISSDAQAQPRAGASYRFKKTNTVIRASYGRFMLTPYNENLVLSSQTGQGGLASNVFGALTAQPLRPAHRNYYTIGLAQAFGRYVSVDADYFWKYTDPDFDFDVLFNTSLTFPIQWQKSKIDGASIKINVPDFHGVTAYAVMGHTRARFFGPEIGGIIFNAPTSTGAFRIDHDQAFEQITHVQYQPNKKYPWFGFSWNYQSGEVAGAVPFAANSSTPVSLAGLTADQQLQAGIHCGNSYPALDAPLLSCSPSQLAATRVVIPAPGTKDPDRNPARIAPRTTFDASAGLDNVFRRDRLKTDLRITAVNVTNKDALYNFLSTFSGTHFLTPRALTAQLELHF